MKYSYKAIINDKVETKVIEANSENDVLAYLRKNKYTPIKIEQITPTFSSFNTIFNKVSFNDIVNLTRQIAIMLNAGLTLVDSLNIIEKQTTKEELLSVVKNLEKDILGGKKFSEALRKYPQLFSNLYISLIRSGEASGKLSDILLRLADNLEKEREFQTKIKGSLTYPVIVITGMGGVMFVMMTFVVPKLLGLYKDFNIELPLSTKILITVSTFMANFWPIILIVLFAAFTLIQRFIKTPKGKSIFDRFLLKIPVFGKIISISALVDSTRTLSILIGSGVSILDTLSIIIDTTNNIVYHDAFKHILQQVEKGQKLGDSFANEGIFPPILIQMASVGEQTGHLDDTMMRISHYFELESETAVKTMSTLIEPLILVVLGVGVGFLVISVITPIYSLTSSFK